MKRIILYSACLVLLIQASCTKKFDKINTNPSQTTADLFNANYLLAQGEWQYSNTGYTQLLFEKHVVAGIGFYIRLLWQWR